MKNQFNFNRFQLLVKRQWIENKKLFLMGIGVLFGLGIVFYAVTTSWRGANLDKAVQAASLIIGLFLGGAIFTNFIYKDFSEKSNITGFMMLPASHLEKLAVGMFYGLVLYPIVLFSIFFIIDFSFVTYINANHVELLENNKEAIKNWKENVPFLNQILEKPITDLQIFFGSWLVSQTFTILGSISFSRLSIIKTAVAAFCILVILLFISWFFQKVFIGNMFENIPGNGFINTMNEVRAFYEMTMKLWTLIVIFILPTILVIASYFKLKEKQV